MTAAARRVTTAALAALIAAGLALGSPAAHAADPDPLQPDQWGLAQVHAPEAWARATGSAVLIAIVDTGIDLDHPDLAGKVVPGNTFLGCGSAGCGDGDWTSGPADRAGSAHPHGTHVAGIAAAATGNGTGIAGVAPDAQLLAVKVIDGAGGTMADVARGIRYAVDRGANVINLSLGPELPISGPSSTVSDAIAYAHQQGAIVVSSAGNDGLPSCDPSGVDEGLVCVVATDKREERAVYSDFDLSQRFITVAAPGGSALPICGEDVLSTVPIGSRAQQCTYPEGYVEIAGTSMAAPHASGVAALLLSQGRERANALFALQSTARHPDTGARGTFSAEYGYGIVDAAAATLVEIPSETSDDETTRLSGSDRIGTAVEISRNRWSAGAAGGAVLARADAFPDALAGAPLADERSGPLLLTRSDELDQVVAEELRRTLPSGATVDLLGGEAALSADVEQAVRDLGFSTRRFSGADRYATAVDVAERGLGNPSLLLVADGTRFPDALPAGAAGAARDGAVLLTAGSAMPEATGDYIDQHPTAERYAIGGPAAEADPGATPIVGDDRYETAVLVAEEFFDAPTVAGLASGEAFADALAGGPHAGGQNGPLLMTRRSDLPGVVRSYLEANRESISELFVYGGSAAVSEPVAGEAAAAAS